MSKNVITDEKYEIVASLRDEIEQLNLQINL